jgi:hypothetical protein
LGRTLNGAIAKSSLRPSLEQDFSIETRALLSASQLRRVPPAGQAARRFKPPSAIAVSFLSVSFSSSSVCWSKETQSLWPSCPDTGRKFYDLNKDPVISPYTGKVVPVEVATTRRATAALSGAR